MPLRNLARPVLDRIPIDEPREPRVVYEVGEALVAPLRVLDVATRDHLVVELAHGEHETLSLVLLDDPVQNVDFREGLGSECDVAVGLLHGAAPVTGRLPR